MRRKKQYRRRFQISRDPEICERVFADSNDVINRLFAAGNVLEYIGDEQNLIGQKMVVVSRSSIMLNSDGITGTPNVRTFVLFENGSRRTMFLDLADDVKLIGTVSSEQASAWDSKVKDPTVPNKYKPHLIKIVV